MSTRQCYQGLLRQQGKTSAISKLLNLSFFKTCFLFFFVVLKLVWDWTETKGKWGRLCPLFSHTGQLLFCWDVLQGTS